MTSFNEAVDRFEKAAPWLGDADLPAVVTLRAIAVELDNGTRTPALLGQWGLTYRNLLARAPKADEPETDPLALALSEAEA